MGYKDPKKQKEFQAKWVAAKRALFFQDKCCRECGTKTNLELDHIDPSKKWSHRIWSYNWTRIMKEVAKCQVLCTECHLRKTAKDISEMRKRSHGTEDGYVKYHCRCDECKPFIKLFPSEGLAFGFTPDEASEILTQAQAVS